MLLKGVYMSISNYSKNVKNLSNDYMYKYRYVYINCNYANAQSLAEYKESLGWWDIALVSKYVDNYDNDWSIVYNDKRIEHHDLTQKVRYEVKFFQENCQVIEVSNFELLEQYFEQIIDCFRKSYLISHDKSFDQKIIDLYMGSVKKHIEEKTSNFFIVRFREEIIGLACVNVLIAAKSINLMNLKINYSVKKVSVGTGFVYFLNNFYGAYFDKGYVFHAGTLSVFHKSQFHDRILMRKLKFKKKHLEQNLVTNKFFYFMLFILYKVIKLFKIKHPLATMISNISF